MPHVIVKLYAGRPDREKSRLADALGVIAAGAPPAEDEDAGLFKGVFAALLMNGSTAALSAPHASELAQAASIPIQTYRCMPSSLVDSG